MKIYGSSTFSNEKRYMIYSTSARILEVLRNVPGVLFIKITLFERSEFVIFMNAFNTRIIP